MRKKKILIQTNYANSKTGFGKNAKNLLTYLYKTGKYELINYANGIVVGNPDFARFPWKTLGSIPNNQQEIDVINRDQALAKEAGYGGYLIDRIIQEEKPDVWIGIEDPWGFTKYYEKKWYPKTNTILSTTIDSLPLLQEAVDYAKNEKNFFVWSEFAERAYHKLGIKNVKTIHGMVDHSNFKALNYFDKEDLRRANGIEPDAFVGIFVFRNQLRKSLPNLLEGYKKFRDENPEINKSYLILHTHAGEGWNIKRQIELNGINPNEILITYTCRACGNWHVAKYTEVEKDCPFCGAQKGMITCNVMNGITEEDLCKVYNLADYYIHPFTSGGMEIPIFEAKLCELPTIVTNYSCGEDACVPESATLPLEFSSYHEHGTEFQKASTYPSSIAKQIKKVLKMDRIKRKELGVKGREWTIKNYSIEAVGKQWEELLDSLPLVDSDFKFEYATKAESYPMKDISSNLEWVKDLYKGVLNMDVSNEDSGVKHWLETLERGIDKNSVLQFFVGAAKKENLKNSTFDFSTLFDEDDEGRRILLAMPQSFGDCYLVTSLFRSIAETYPEYNLYIGCLEQYSSIFEGNPYVHKVIPWIPQMDNSFFLEGQGSHKGFVDIYLAPYFQTQRLPNYTHNGLKFGNLELKY